MATIAQIAGEIVSTGLKLKSLLDEIHKAPDSLRHVIDQIRVLAPILHEAGIDESDAIEHSVALNGSLGAAIIQCRNCVD